MYNAEEMQKLQGDCFYMEFLDEDAHSMTDEEIYDDLDRKIKLAIEGVDDFRREHFRKQLEKQGIDPSSVDIDKELGIEKQKKP